MKKPEQNIRYESDGEQTVRQEIMNAYQSGVIEDDVAAREEEQRRRGPMPQDDTDSRTANLLKDDELEEKNPDDFE
ncbi:hypothetical protein JQN58_16895 [Aneurinibacillus sp. BA2021]|nr:hypothetical protein [Aneurinibacillus sp. BA2021]